MAEDTVGVKTYYVYKKLDVPAKLIGLNYNTFFIFLGVSALLLMVASSKGVPGFIVAGILIGATYLGLFFVQTKLGPKKMAKRMSGLLTPIHHMKMQRSVKKTKFDEFR